MGWGIVGDVVSGAKDLAGDAAKAAGDKFDDALDSAKDTVDDAIDTAGDVAKGVGKAVSNASISDIGHTALDVAGMVPVIGEAADLANAGWYLAEGDKVNAALSAAGAIPFAGNAATATKWAKKGVDAADLATDVAKVAGKAGDATKIADTSLPGGFRQVSTGGKRGDVPLTGAQKTEISNYADKLGVPDGVVKFSDEMNTSYGSMFGKDVLYVGTDVMPAASSAARAGSANSRVSAKGAMAHEWVGHRGAAVSGKTQDVPALEEAQASIRAARFAPDLSSTERVTLLRDGVERLHGAGLRVADVKDKLWIGQP